MIVQGPVKKMQLDELLHGGWWWWGGVTEGAALLCSYRGPFEACTYAVCYPQSFRP